MPLRSDRGWFVFWQTANAYGARGAGLTQEQAGSEEVIEVTTPSAASHLRKADAFEKLCKACARPLKQAYEPTGSHPRSVWVCKAPTCRLYNKPQRRSST